MRRLLTCGLLLAASPGLATVAPIPSNDDNRIGIVRRAAGDEVRLDTIAGNDLTILPPRGEQISTVELGDVAAWHVAVSPTRDAVVIYALRPVTGSAMTMQTDRGTYRFMLNAVTSGTFPYLVRIESGGFGGSSSPPKIWTPPVIVEPGVYSLSGDKTVLPSVIRDDGRKVYIQWPASQALPAVFSLDAKGREEMVEGYMREGTFTIDHLVEQLVFRLDKAQGKAKRVVRKAAR